MTKVATYGRQTAEGGPNWIAYALLPNGQIWPVRCEGATEAEASAKAIALYELECGKWEKREPEAKSEGWGTVTDDWGKPADKRGHHFAGKVWMMHIHTRQKVRIDASEIASYEANNYVRGGPRSK